MNSDPRFEALTESNPEALLADGFEEAYLGFVCGAWHGEGTAVYSRAKCISILMERDGMDWETAEEFFEFNVAGAFVGKYTPMFLVEPNTETPTESQKAQ